MFKVKDKFTGEILTVYAVLGTRFMLWRYNQWFFEPIEDFEPIEE